jgi:hypothetical protein|tara:strand:+ start:1886 stop:2026 length:141 start_codon:yes stop_codon:yes gene_type:complete
MLVSIIFEEGWGETDFEILDGAGPDSGERLVFYGTVWRQYGYAYYV